MKIFVSLGTDMHPFERLLTWAERYAEEHPDDDVLIQYGHSRAPVAGRCQPFLGSSEIAATFAASDVVVVSCGPGAVMDARAAGRRPVIIARRHDLGEHVDDHQLAFATHLAEKGLGRCIVDGDGFRAALADAAVDPDSFRCESTVGAPAGIARIGDLIDDLVRGQNS